MGLSTSQLAPMAMMTNTKSHRTSIVSRNFLEPQSRRCCRLRGPNRQFLVAADDNHLPRLDHQVGPHALALCHRDHVRPASPEFTMFV